MAVTGSCDWCAEDAVFQRVTFTTTRNSVASFCQKHRIEHDMKLLVSKELRDMPVKTPPPSKSAEDILAESAITILRKLIEFQTPAAVRAMDRIADELESLNERL